MAFTIGVVTSVFASLLIWTTETPLDALGSKWIIIGILIALPILEVIGYWIARHLFGNIKILGQLARFGMVGIMNFLVDTGILTLLSLFTGIVAGAWIIPLNVISTSIAVANSYIWNRSWTFRDSAPVSLSAFITFVVVTIGGILINSLIVYGVIEYLPVTDSLTGARRITIAKMLATIVSLLWNFFGYRLIVFKKQHEVIVGQ